MARDMSNRKLECLDQAYAVRRSNQTFVLQFALVPPASTDSVPVMTMHSPFSRFILTLIDNSGNERKIMKGNIRAEEVPFLLRQYDFAVHGKHDFLANKDERGDDASDPMDTAFKVRLRAGAMKGRTPAEILLEDPTKEGELTRHRKWLEDHLGTYPGNQEVIDAIDNALYLQSVGELDSKVATSFPKDFMIIYKEDYKYMTGASPSTKTSAKIEIGCEYQEEYPWKITLENSEVPFQNDNGNMVLLRDQAKDQRKGTIHLSDKEMEYLIYKIGALLSQFENHFFASAYNFIQENAWPRNK